MKKSLLAMSVFSMIFCGAIYFCVQAKGQSPARSGVSKPAPVQANAPQRQERTSPRHENDPPRPENNPPRYGIPSTIQTVPGMGQVYVQGWPTPGTPGMPGTPGGIPPQAFPTYPAAPSYPAIPPRNAGPDGRVETPHEVREALHKLKSQELSESEKSDAKATIREFLTEAFEKDQKARRSHVERLEEQLDRLKKQLEKRQEAQTKIIDLRMQLLENEADGLSFPDSWVEFQTYQTGTQIPMSVPGRPMASLPGFNWLSPENPPGPSASPGPNANPSIPSSRP